MVSQERKDITNEKEFQIASVCACVIASLKKLLQCGQRVAPSFILYVNRESDIAILMLLSPAPEMTSPDPIVFL